MRGFERTVGVIGTLLVVAMPLAAQDGVYINGEHVTQREIAAELAPYGIHLDTPIPAGAYWYDRVSGLWGYEGGPTIGQVLPGLELGGRLQSNASGDDRTGVFLNGREIDYLEYVYFQRIFGYVIPGRYWLNAQGIAGPEGGQAMFNLVAAARQAGVGGGGGGGYHRRSLFGDMGSDGNCFYYNHPNGSSVSNC